MLPLADTWDGVHVTAAHPAFDLEESLLAAIEREELPVEPATDLDGLFSFSPLTTPESTPPSTPPSSPQLLPTLLPGSTPDGTPIDSDDLHAGRFASNNRKSKPEGRKARRQIRKYATRQKQRERAKEEYGHHRRCDKFRLRYMNDSQAIDCDVVLENAKVTSTGFTGLDDKSRPRQLFHLDEVVGEGSTYNFRLIKWNGRDAIPIRDTKRRVLAVLAGQPNDPTWPSLAIQAAHALEERRNRVRIPENKLVHRRGTFTALSTGVSHGQGQTHPKNLTHKGSNARVLQELNGMEAFKRFAGFSSSVMASWAPGLYDHYVTTLGELYQKNPTLKQNFPSSIFTAATYNFGPRTACFKHVDFANLPFGWCSVTALGSFDPTKGGHLILWNCGLVIEFPPGSTILLPSAIIAHSNVDIAEHETRYSFAQYSAGALFRWVSNGHKKATVYNASLSPAQQQEVKAKNKKRFKLGLSLFPTLKKEGTEVS